MISLTENLIEQYAEEYIRNEDNDCSTFGDYLDKRYESDKIAIKRSLRKRLIKFDELKRRELHK